MTEPSLERTLLTATNANRDQLLRTAVPPKTYAFVWRSYVKWLKNDPQIRAEQPPFLTRDNIHHYFTRVVACKKIVPGSAKRYVTALQWYADYDPTEGHASAVRGSFKVCDATVETALRAQKAHYRESGGSGNLGSDPHKGLKDVLSLPQRRRILQYIYRARTSDWGPASVNFTWGLNVAVRGDSSRKLNFCDLNVSRGYGPEEDGPLSRALLLVLRKGPVHKDRKDKDQQVGCWRHKHYELCSVFSTSAHVVWTLLEKRGQINFYHDDKTARCEWWDLPLIDWETYSGKFLLLLCNFCFLLLINTVLSRDCKFHTTNLQGLRNPQLQAYASSYQRYTVSRVNGSSP
jgi:hypothetical protein